MKRIFSVVLLLALLAGCSAAPAPVEPAPGGSVPEEETEEKAVVLTPYVGAVSQEYPYQMYGLMTTEGEIVTEAECSSLYLAEYSGACWEERNIVPVWVLCKQGPGWPENQQFVALYAENGSWHTDFIYHGCTATPHGLFVGNDAGAFLLDPEDGSERKTWTWEALGIENPAEFRWIIGDAYETAQWIGEKLFLGMYDEKAMMLDLETDEMSTISVEEWKSIQSKRMTQPLEWETDVDDQTVTVIHNIQGKTEETQFQSVIGTFTASVYTKEEGVPRVHVREISGACCAVYSIEGEEIIPVQDGEVQGLGFYDRPNRSICVRNPQEKTAKIYDWDGNLKFTLPLTAEDYVVMNGSLIQITDYTTRAAYYDPETGELVREFTFAEPVEQLVPYMGGKDRYGLMTNKGQVITEPVCASIVKRYSGETPFWAMTLPGPDPNWPDVGGMMALAAVDYSWSSDYIYTGCTRTPYGIFAGKNQDQEFVLLDASEGVELKHWTREELQLDSGTSFPWFTGDAYETAQWTGEKLFLGSRDFSDRRAVLLDLETYEITTMSSEEWNEFQWERLQEDVTWSSWLEELSDTAWITREDKTTGEKTRYTFSMPYAADWWARRVERDGEIRIIVTERNLDSEKRTGGVFSLDGQELVPVQTGDLSAWGESREWQTIYFTVEDLDAGEVRVYSWNGAALCALPMEEGDWVWVEEGLIQISDMETHAAYYDPETGELVAEFEF
jgi:hypothetical protein